MNLAFRNVFWVCGLVGASAMGHWSCVLELEPAAVDCVSTVDCGSENVCFFGRCVDPGYNISEVYVDLLPPNSSQFLAQPDDSSPRELEKGLEHDLVLRSSVIIKGAIEAASENREGVLTALPQIEEAKAALPSAQTGVSASVGESGFRLSVVPGTYNLSFEPSQLDRPRPPMRWMNEPLLGGAGAASLLLDYPADGELQQVDGRLLYSQRSQTPIAGAEVRAVVVDDDQLERIISSSVTSTDSGTFSFAVGPEVRFYDLSVSPGENLAVPTMNLPDVSLEESLIDFELGVEAEKISVAIQVQQAGGLPEADANLILAGTVGSEAIPGTYVTSIRTDGNGFALTELFPGLYTINAVPLKSSASGTQAVVLCVADEFSLRNYCGGSSHDFSEPVLLRLPQKQRLEGTVRSHSGQPVVNARVKFNRKGNAIAREFSTTTDSFGKYGIYLDQASLEVAYEITVEPAVADGLPRYLGTLAGTQEPKITHDIELYPASFVYGRVLAPNSEPVADVVISFYSTTLGTNAEPLLVGLGRSTDNGEFVIALPRLD